MVTGKGEHSASRVEAGTQASRLYINVIYTDSRSTLRALRDAAGLASSLNVRIRIVLPAIVPYPLKLEEPPVCEFHHRRMLKAVANGVRIETVAEIVYCREYADLNRALPPHSIVVIGGRREWWWPWSAANGVGRVLNAGGHHVIRVAGKENPRA